MASQAQLLCDANSTGLSLFVALRGVSWNSHFFLGAGCQDGHAVCMARAVSGWMGFLVYARHAGDGEKIVLQGGQLVVELETAGRMQRAEFNREWVRVEPCKSDGSLIEVSGQGLSVSVGRHLRPELRPALAREIRSVLRTPTVYGV